MARPLRIEYDNALHHVISRGDNRRRIVWDDDDRLKRLAWLERVVGEFGWTLHAFCLMTNPSTSSCRRPTPTWGRA